MRSCQMRAVPSPRWSCGDPPPTVLTVLCFTPHFSFISLVALGVVPSLGKLPGVVAGGSQGPGQCPLTAPVPLRPTAVGPEQQHFTGVSLTPWATRAGSRGRRTCSGPLHTTPAPGLTDGAPARLKQASQNTQLPHAWAAQLCQDWKSM